MAGLIAILTALIRVALISVVAYFVIKKAHVLINKKRGQVL